MGSNSAQYTKDDLVVVARYLTALVSSDWEEHRDALAAVLAGNPYARLVALGHLSAGLMVESDTPPEQVVAAVFDLAGRVGDALADERDE
ncbi:hypothetical protein [Dietzia sp. MNB45]|uniref:hypothetical protein n=1 Tax=Dietzia sp. MNB45 TaxID=3238800 RepID=UPI003F7E0CED